MTARGKWRDSIGLTEGARSRTVEYRVQVVEYRLKKAEHSIGIHGLTKGSKGNIRGSYHSNGRESYLFNITCIIALNWKQD